jgi:hypothetical protein
MSTKQTPVWFCPRAVIDHNLQLARIAHMDIRKLKAIKAAIVSLAILAVALFAIHSGGDPTTIAWIALAGLALINGIEVGELLAVMATAADATNDTDEDDDP